MRRLFADLLLEKMKTNKKIYLIVGDLGYKVWDEHFKLFPDRCINVGAAEQSMLGVAVGLALDGKMPFCYSITNFILYRPFEWVRNYLQGEGIPVKLIASGRNCDYDKDGYSHQSTDAYSILKALHKIAAFFPTDQEDVKTMFVSMLKNKRPSFISLKRS